jgi:hypothetical protein
VPESSRTALRLQSNGKRLSRSGTATKQRWCINQSLRRV